MANNFISNFFDSQQQQETNYYSYPEPGFVITIKPTLQNGNKTESGQRVIIQGISQPITLVTINISHNQQTTTLIGTSNQPINTFEGIFLKSMNVSNYICEQQGAATLNLTIANQILNNNGEFLDLGYDLESPLIDLFQSGFIVTISQFNQQDTIDIQQLFVGSISDVNIDYDNKGLALKVNVESLLTTLNRSACVQTALNQNGEQIFINTLTSQPYNFNNLLLQLLNETIISQWLASINYYKAPSETEAIGNNGSAIGVNSKIFVDTPPTDSKLMVILRTLYPYQRVFYVDNDGNFVITPLQAYYDLEQNWEFSINGDVLPMLLAKISINKRSATVLNRSTTSLLQLYSYFNPTTNTNGVSGAVAVAVPSNANNYFPRLNDFISSQAYLQTLASVQEINTNLLNNAGLLNIATNFNNITGLTNPAVIVDDNLNYIETTDQTTNKLKYYLRLYAARGLTEQLFNETTITLTVPTNLTYNLATGVFRKIPLNQLVILPTVKNNRILDGINQYFCYGYELNYDASQGAMTTLHLTKPYTYTALWSNEQVVLFNSVDR